LRPAPTRTQRTFRSRPISTEFALFSSQSPALKLVLDAGAILLSFFVNALGIEQSGPLGSDPALRIGAVCLQRGLFERVHHCPGQSRAPGQDHARTVGVNVRLGRGLAFLSNDAPL